MRNGRLSALWADRVIGRLATLGMLAAGGAEAGTVEVLHADSLAGPMSELKKAFEAKSKDVVINLTSGVSRQLAERILKGERCDVFASSSPAVIDEDLMAKTIAGSGAAGASWYVVFSANEMVVIVEKANPRGIRGLSDLAKPGVTFARATGDSDLATGRTIEFLNRASGLEGKPELAQAIIAKSIFDPSKPTSVPEIVSAVREGRANAGVVYYSAAVAARGQVDIIRFPDIVNLSETIRNAATVPGKAQNPEAAIDFVRFLLTPEAHGILTATGQPPVIPWMVKGKVPAAIGR